MTRQILITGASSDIGLALCQKYLDQGDSIVALYNSGHPQFFKFIEEHKNIRPLQIDFSDPINLEQALEKQLDTFISCDVFINAAAAIEAQPFAEVTSQSILRALHTNLIPGLIIMQAVAPAMVERGWGRIVHLSSIGVKFGGGSSSFCYSLSKHALEFLPSDHKVWAAHNVFANVLRIGVTDTRFHRNDPGKDMSTRISLIPARRMATPDEMANSIYCYGSDENTFTTGQVITIAGGE
jgi:NAD(P)-dependent dehydrogenase (short-subunit alcohol dehydrogenase family)